MSVRTVFANFLSMASLRLGLAGLTFALFWLLSHDFSTTQLGGFSLLMNVFFMVQTLPLLGMTMPLIRRTAAQPADTAAETSNSFYFALPVAVLLGVGLAAVGASYGDAGLQLPFALLGLSMLPTAWIAVAECVLVGRERMQGIAYVNLFEAVGRLAGAGAAIHWHAGLTGVFVAFLAMRCAAGLAYLYNRHLPAPQWHLVRLTAWHAYRRETPTYLSIAVVTALATRLDIVLVSKLLSLHDAGLYAAAARLSDAALMVPTMAAVVIFPSQARLYVADRAAFGRVLEQAVRWSLIVGFAAALFVVASAPTLIHWIYTPNLWGSAALLQILILGAAVMIIDQMLSTTMMAARAPATDLRSMTLGLVVLTLCLTAFTRFLGLPGAALAPPAALLVRVAYRLRWAQGELSIPLLTLALRVLVAAAVAAGLLFVKVSSSTPVDLLLAYATYALVLWVTRSVDAAGWRALRALIAAGRGARA